MQVLHIHARDENHKPTMRLDKFRETVRLVKERDPDVVIQISTGGRAPLAGVSPYTWRMDPLNLLPEMASYTPGSVNLGPIVYQNDAKLTRELAEKFRDLDIKPQVELNVPTELHVYIVYMYTHVCTCAHARVLHVYRYTRIET